MAVLGIILGIIAILCAVFATFLFGTVGGIIAGLLGAGAIVLGFLKRKKDGKGGIGAIAVGALSLIMAISLTGTWSTMFSDIHKKAADNMPDSLWAQVSEETNGGLMGIINRLPQDEASINQLVEEMQELNKLAEK